MGKKWKMHVRTVDTQRTCFPTQWASIRTLEVFKWAIGESDKITGDLDMRGQILHSRYETILTGGVFSNRVTFQPWSRSRH